MSSTNWHDNHNTLRKSWFRIFSFPFFFPHPFSRLLSFFLYKSKIRIKRRLLSYHQGVVLFMPTIKGVVVASKRLGSQPQMHRVPADLTVTLVIL